jgi:PleD family two-component response regulator
VSSEEWVSLSIETLFAPRGYAVLRGFNGEQAMQRVREMPPDLLVIAKDLRDMRGVDLCAELRVNGWISRVTPVVLIGTSPWTREERLEALRAGSWDTCSLPMDGEELFLRIDQWVQAKLAADTSSEQGLLDSATGFYNAHGLLRRIAELGAGAGRHGRALACVVISADFGTQQVSFEKRLSTTSLSGGPADATGMFVSRLRAAGRASDAIGRLSENEFVVVAPDTDSEGALGLANRLKLAIESAAAPTVPLRLRFGCYAVGDFRDASIAPTELLVRATEALRETDVDRESIRFFGRRIDNMN